MGEGFGQREPNLERNAHGIVYPLLVVQMAEKKLVQRQPGGDEVSW